MAKRRRKTRTHLKGPNNSAAAATTGPKSFVIRSGKVGRSVGDLVRDVRNVMEPNTATKLRERTSNRLRDFLTMCGPLGVTHLLMFSQKHSQDGSDSSSWGNINMRIARAPRGPTCTFRINKFALAKDVVASQRRPRAPGGEYTTPPLLVLNNFGSQEKHVRLLVTVFQNLFPPIHVQSMRLSQARRIVLLNYNEATGTIDLRHYLISVRPVGVSRRVRRVVEGTSGRSALLSGAPASGSSSSSTGKRRLVNLADTGDIADWILGRSSAAGASSSGGGPGSETGSGFETDASSASEAESENEDGVPSNHVDLPSTYMGRGNVGGSKRAIRLRELGPRIEMRCIKIEEGIPGAGKTKGEREGGHEVLWHDYVRKSHREADELRRAAEEKRDERRKRREEQEDNVRRKKEEKERTKGKGKEEREEDDDVEQAVDDIPPVDEDEDEDEDEFAYEDRFAPKEGSDDDEAADLFDEGDELDEEDSVGEMSDEGEQSVDEEEEEEDEGSDMSPIPIGRMMHDSDINEDEDEDEEQWDDADEEEDDDDESEEEQSKAKKVKMASGKPKSAAAAAPKPKQPAKTRGAKAHRR